MATFGYYKGRVAAELKEDEDPILIGNKINDAVESLFESILLVCVQQFMQGPIQSISMAPGSERTTLVSIPDPLVAPTPSQIGIANALPFPRTGYFAYTWVTESGSETNLSPLASFTINFANQVFYVPGAPLPSTSPVGAIGWNLYASYNPAGQLALQNSVPLDFTVQWQEDAAIGIITDPDSPAPPTANTTADNIFYMKVIEAQNLDLTWTRWEGASIDGLMFQRAARNLPVASTYQSYAWDILRGNQLEIRPAAGMQLNPRHFYVAKPRRIRFDNAELPFQNFAAEEFIINFAISRVNLTNREYEAHQIWEGLADKKRLQTLQAIGDSNVQRQTRITPYM